MYLLSEQRLADWLQQRLGSDLRLLQRTVLPSFQQYAEQLRIEQRGHVYERVLRLYAARFNLWPPFDGDLGALVALVLPVLRQQGVACAELITAGPYLPGAQALLLDWLPGRSLQYPLADAEIEGVAQLLARLHAVKPPADLPCYPLDQLLQHLQQYCVELQLTVAGQVLRALAPELGEEQAVWLHGDAHVGNVLRDERAGLALIDWDETAQADYRFDIAYAWAQFARWQDQRAAERFIAAYREASGRAPEQLTVWWRFLNARDHIAVEYLRASRAADIQRSDVQNWLQFGDSSFEAMLETDAS